jgi:hypothetical protein
MLENFLTKLIDALSTSWGWLIGAIMFVVNLVVGYEAMISFVVLAVVIDAFWGIASSLKQHKFTLSELGRNSLGKLAVYGTSMLLFIIIDKLLGINNGLPTNVICVSIILVEVWSTSASMLICFPNMPFLQLMKRALTGEIASKLNVPPSEVEEVLKALKKKKD